MKFLVLRAYCKLMAFELYVREKNFVDLYRMVRDYPLNGPSALKMPVEHICMAVDLACIWYWKHVLCLQRSAATACLLKRYGVPARMVIGAQQIPFKAHAWVEVEGCVVNDKPYMREMYAVIDQC